MTSYYKINSTVLGEGHSTMRPHLLNCFNYSYWRTRMKLFIEANDYEVWRIVTNGLFIPMKRVEGVFIPKEESGWDKNDIKKIKLNEKAMHTLFYAFGVNKHNTVSSKPEEGINEISDRFTYIINGLKALGKIYPNKEMEKKMLNSHPTS
ncbi:hypothetical protein J1N35_034158 [Gossypium stocksii]|uniref:DUF4219 domain-containing protein n=1 Tax=Gossypium stocksii TaxID=47602 RepID=A0A9D3ZPY5_9ROSI|nr:hypothetical protein J1N35_034158 [Gossypium stocksii]